MVGAAQYGSVARRLLIQVLKISTGCRSRNVLTLRSTTKNHALFCKVTLFCMTAFFCGGDEPGLTKPLSTPETAR